MSWSLSAVGASRMEVKDNFAANYYNDPNTPKGDPRVIPAACLLCDSGEQVDAPEGQVFYLQGSGHQNDDGTNSWVSVHFGTKPKE